MPAYNAIIPSGSIDGKMKEVNAIATLGDELHTAVTGTNHMDEIWVWAINHAATAKLLTIEFGGVTGDDDLIEYSVPSQDGLHLVVPGIRLQNGLVVRAFCETADVVSCAVNVNRIIQVESE
jgi:hypothetical protein